MKTGIVDWEFRLKPDFRKWGTKRIAERKGRGYEIVNNYGLPMSSISGRVWVWVRTVDCRLKRGENFKRRRETWKISFNFERVHPEIWRKITGMNDRGLRSYFRESRHGNVSFGEKDWIFGNRNCGLAFEIWEWLWKQIISISGARFNNSIMFNSVFIWKIKGNIIINSISNIVKMIRIKMRKKVTE